jgi:hypothetical protein
MVWNSRASILQAAIAAFSVLTVLTVSGCATKRVTMFHQDPDFKMEVVKENNVLLITSSQVAVKEFKASYAAVFGESDSLPRRITETVRDSLTQAGMKVAVDTALNRLFARMEEGLPTAEDAAELRTKLAVVDAKYAMRIRSVTVSNQVSRNGVMMAPAGGGGTMMVGGGSQESCVIQYDVDIWDTTTLKKKASVSVNGSSKVFLFAFQTSLINAVDASARHLVGYVLRNQTDFL